MILTTFHSNKSYTFPFENRKNITAIALSPDANVLVTVDEGMFNKYDNNGPLNSLLTADGRALLVNFRRGVILHHFNFHKQVKDIKFSPDGKYVSSILCHIHLIPNFI
jgi:periodic tryptophan protein 2